MIDDAAVQLALRTQLLSVAGLPVGRAWENREFEPTLGTPWIRETFLPADENRVSTGLGQSVGFVQYDLFYPPNEGINAADAMALAVKNAFKPGFSFAPDLVVVRSQRLRAVPEADWYMVPVRIFYRAHAAL